MQFNLINMQTEQIYIKMLAAVTSTESFDVAKWQY